MTDLMDEYMFWWKQMHVEIRTQGQPSAETNMKLKELEDALNIRERTANQVKNRGIRE